LDITFGLCRFRNNVIEARVALRAMPSLQMDRRIIGCNRKAQPTIMKEHLRSVVIKHTKMKSILCIKEIAYTAVTSTVFSIESCRAPFQDLLTSELTSILFNKLT